MVDDADAVDMLVTNLEKYFNNNSCTRIRKKFDYNVNVQMELPEIYNELGFPGTQLGEYYLIEEEIMFEMKYLSNQCGFFSEDTISLGFAYDKKSLQEALLETDSCADFSKCIFNEDLVISQEAVNYFNELNDEMLKKTIHELFTPIVRIDNSEYLEAENLSEVITMANGIILKFKFEIDRDVNEHEVKIYFKMPRLWNSIFEITLVDPTKEPHIKLKYNPSKMDVQMYSYLNKDSQANTRACIQRAGMYDIAIKDEWIHPKSGVIFDIKKKTSF